MTLSAFSRCACTAACCLLFAGPAWARPDMAGTAAETSFARMDADKNGAVSQEEFFAAYPQMREAAFAAIDANGDGSISLEEWKGFAENHAAAESRAHAGQAAGDGPDGSASMPDMVVPPAE